MAYVSFFTSTHACTREDGLCLRVLLLVICSNGSEVRVGTISYASGVIFFCFFVFLYYII